MDFSWAAPFPDVHRICTLFQLTELLNPVKYCYRPLPSFIQEGPQCGLVALAMCINESIQSDTKIKETVQLLLESAKMKKFTYNGEMFSVNDMYSLAKETLPGKEIEMHSGDLNCDKIKEFLLNGGFLLTPYDTDKDNSPSMQKGHKAHWAIISGAIQTEDDIFVLARHGKARNVAIWKLTELAASNSQLFEFSPDRKLQNMQYKLPEGGLHGELGLSNKSICIKDK